MTTDTRKETMPGLRLGRAHATIPIHGTTVMVWPIFFL